MWDAYYEVVEPSYGLEGMHDLPWDDFEKFVEMFTVMTGGGLDLNLTPSYQEYQIIADFFVSGRHRTSRRT